ncbi:hypothetical protein JW758_05790 [Candidatus Peregrinibacteria bacterium]|nr:hypothetical protein [Candidatus Peregrinibacteria bacterium]
MDIFRKNKLSVCSYFEFNHVLFSNRMLFYTPESLEHSNNAIDSAITSKRNDVIARMNSAKRNSKEWHELNTTLDEINTSRDLIESPVTDERSANSAIEEIDLSNAWLANISKSGVRAQDVLTIARYKHFFDDATTARFNQMFTQLQTSFNVSDVLRTNNTFVPDNIQSQAERMVDKKDTEVKLEKIREQKLSEYETQFQIDLKSLKTKYDSNDIDFAKYSNERSKLIKQRQDFIESLQRDDFIDPTELTKLLKETNGMTDSDRQKYLDSVLYKLQHKEKMNLLTEKSKGFLSGTEIDKIKSVLVEVRRYRGLALHEHIQGRLDGIRKIYEEHSWPAQDLDLLEKGLRDKSEYLQDPDSIKSVLDAIKKLEFRTNAIVKKEARLQTPENKEKLSYLEREFAKFTINPEKASLIAKLIPNPNEGSVIYLKKAQGVANLAEYQQFLSDLKADANSANQQERFDASVTIDEVYTLLRRAEADKATRIINGLSVCTTTEEMMKFVMDNASDHVELIKTTTEFNSKYGDYTSGGMVFYRRGEEWKVIINEQKMNDPGTDPEKFKEQMIHEMHHVEYDYNQDITDSEYARFTNNKKWIDIKQAFIDKANANPTPKMPPTFKGNPKSAYTIKDWEDADVVSELYAMQETMANHSIAETPNQTPFDKLVSLVASAGLLAEINKPNAKISGFEGKDDAVIRGAEDDGGSSPKQTNGTSVASQVASSADETTNDFKTSNILNRIKAIRETGVIGNIPDAAEILKVVEDKCNDNPSDTYLESAEGAIGKVEDAIKDYTAKNPKGSDNPIRDLWNGTTFLSIDDIVQLGKFTYEFYQRRHKRRTEDHAAKLGEALFSNIPFLKELGMDASANKEKAEAEYVNEWKGRLENKDAWVLLSMIDKMGNQPLPDKDQLKAILRILSEKGRIDWTQPGLWKTLNKLQAGEKFDLGDQFLLQNPDALNQKIMAAMGEMWDFDEFQQLLNKNESSYSSKKEDYMKTYDKLQGRLDSRLYELLSLHRNDGNADPAEFEAILEYAIKNGKSHQENVFFYLISGMASGLLAADRGIHLDKHLNLFPPLDWFTFLKPPPTQQWFENLCNTYFKDEYKNGKKQATGTGGEFQNFYWTVILNNKDVIERTQKSAKPDAWDHDWSRGISVNGGADTCDRFLSGGSGQKQTRPTAVANAMGGIIQWLEENAKKPGKHWDDNIADHIAWMAMADGIMENVAYSDNKTYTRKEALQGGKPVREGSVGYHGNQSAEWHWRKMQDILDVIDPVLFGYLRNKEMRDEPSNNDKDGKKGVAITNRILTHLKTNYSGDKDLDDTITGINSIDDVFKNLAVIINAVVKANPGKMEQVRNMLVDPKTGQVRAG